MMNDLKSLRKPVSMEAEKLFNFRVDMKLLSNLLFKYCKKMSVCLPIYGRLGSGEPVLLFFTWAEQVCKFFSVVLLKFQLLEISP